jgi:hypothetical protein
MRSEHPSPAGAKWIRSSACVGESNCLEVAVINESIGLRNSQRPAQTLLLDRAAWRAFVAGVEAGEFPSAAGH